MKAVDLTAWAETEAELASLHKQICCIHETPSKEHTPEQKQDLAELRRSCVAVHYRRIALVQGRAG